MREIREEFPLLKPAARVFLLESRATLGWNVQCGFRASLDVATYRSTNDSAC